MAAPSTALGSADDWDDDLDLPSASEGALDDWDDEASANAFSGLSGLSGLSELASTGASRVVLPPVSADDPYAPEVMARLCMLSPGAVMQVARQAPVGAGPVLQLVGSLREAKDEAAQRDLMRRFLGEHGPDGRRTLEMLLGA